MKTEILKVTPNMAQGWLNNSEIKNRRILLSRVYYYADQMARGQWKLTGQGISFDDDNNIIDGQHRLMAVVKSDTTVPFLIISGVNKNTFAAYDDGKTRGGADALYLSGDIKNSSQVAAGIAAYLQYKYSLRMTGGSSIMARASKQDIIDEYEKTPELHQEINNMSSSCYKKMRMFPRSKLSAIILYLIKQRHHSIETVRNFFYEVHGIYPDTNITTKTLRETIIRAELIKRPYPAKVKEIYLHKSWNNWIEGRELKLLKIIDNETKQKLK
jgi:hypothetical protein